MDSGQYICDVLYYNTGTWWRCDYDIVMNFVGYPENGYDDLSYENEHNHGKRNNMKGSYRIVSMLYFKETLAHP